MGKLPTSTGFLAGFQPSTPITRPHFHPDLPISASRRIASIAPLPLPKLCKFPRILCRFFKAKKPEKNQDVHRMYKDLYSYVSPPKQKIKRYVYTYIYIYILYTYYIYISPPICLVEIHPVAFFLGNMFTIFEFSRHHFCFLASFLPVKNPHQKCENFDRKNPTSRLTNANGKKW